MTPPPVEKPTPKPLLSVVVPCFNEEEALPRLMAVLRESLEVGTAGAWEAILVDDGSHDRTAELIREWQAKDGRVKGILLSRNFGHQPAISTGLAYASGTYIGVMDADMQDPPEVLLKCLAKAQAEKLDLVYAVRQTRTEGFLLTLCYRTFYRLMKAFAEHPWPLDSGDFSVFHRRCLRLMSEMPENVRVLRGLRCWVGLKQGSVAYDRPERAAGEAKYGFSSLLALALSSLVGFSNAPLRLASVIGFWMSLATLLLGILILINRFFPHFTLLNYYVGTNPGITTLAVLLCGIGSFLFLCMGILGEYLGLLIREVKRRPIAIVGGKIGDLRKQSGFRDIIEAEPRDDE